MVNALLTIIEEENKEEEENDENSFDNNISNWQHSKRKMSVWNSVLFSNAEL